MNTKYGKLVKVSTGWCHGCDSRIGDETWVFQNGSTTVEARHLVEDGTLTADELAALVAQAQSQAAHP